MSDLWGLWGLDDRTAGIEDSRGPVMYHATSPRLRDSIQQSGLRIEHSEDDPSSIPGIYMSPSPSPSPYSDVWAVDTSLLRHLEPDDPAQMQEFQDVGGSYWTKHDVPIEALRLHQKATQTHKWSSATDRYAHRGLHTAADNGGWYHVTHQKLSPGDRITPGGGESYWTDDNGYADRGNHVWLSDDDEHVGYWLAQFQKGEGANGLPYLYEVNPDQPPAPYDETDPLAGKVTSGATVVRQHEPLDFMPWLDGHHTASTDGIRLAISQHDVYDSYYDDEFDPEDPAEPHDGPWYHYSPHSLPVGTHLTTGHPSPWGDDLYEKDGTEHRRNYVWLSPSLHEAVGWAELTPRRGQPGPGHIYRVEPISDVLPWNGSGSDGWVAEGAHIVEEIPHPWRNHTASTDGIRYAHVVEADVAEDLMRLAAMNENLINRLHEEFHQWHRENGDVDGFRDWDVQRGPIGDWKNVEGFLKDKYPAAHKGFYVGSENVTPLIDHNEDDPTCPVCKGAGEWEDVYGGNQVCLGCSGTGETHAAYETGPGAVSQYGYDPKEIAAAMLLLHNRSHGLRSDLEQADQDRLAEIARLRSRQQQVYEQRTKTAMPAPMPEGITFHHHPTNATIGTEPYIPDPTVEVPKFMAPAVEARHNGETVGYLEWDPPLHATVVNGIQYGDHPPEVSMIKVHPDYRRHGIGTALFDFARQHQGDLEHSDSRTELGNKWVDYEQGRAKTAMPHDDDDYEEENYDEWGERIPNWPKDMVQHLQNKSPESAYRAGYSAQDHPDFYEWDIYDIPSSTKKSWEIAGGHHLDDFEEGIIDGKINRPHKYDDPQGHQEDISKKREELSQKHPGIQNYVQMHNEADSWNPDDDVFDPREFNASQRTAMPWYHNTDAELNPGDMLLPAAERGHDSRWGDGGSESLTNPFYDSTNYDPNNVYVYNEEGNPDIYKQYGKNRYEVEPSGYIDRDPEWEQNRKWHAEEVAAEEGVHPLDAYGLFDDQDVNGYASYVTPRARVIRKIEPDPHTGDYTLPLDDDDYHTAAHRTAMPAPLPRGWVDYEQSRRTAAVDPDQFVNHLRDLNHRHRIHNSRNPAPDRVIADHPPLTHAEEQQRQQMNQHVADLKQRWDDMAPMTADETALHARLDPMAHRNDDLENLTDRRKAQYFADLSNPMFLNEAPRTRREQHHYDALKPWADQYFGGMQQSAKDDLARWDEYHDKGYHWNGSSTLEGHHDAADLRNTADWGAEMTRVAFASPTPIRQRMSTSDYMTVADRARGHRAALEEMAEHGPLHYNPDRPTNNYSYKNVEDTRNRLHVELQHKKAFNYDHIDDLPRVAHPGEAHARGSLVNPRFDLGMTPNGYQSWANQRAYKINCQRCVLAAEARHKGYNVEAQRNYRPHEEDLSHPENDHSFNDHEIAGWFVNPDGSRPTWNDPEDEPEAAALDSGSSTDKPTHLWDHMHNQIKSWGPGARGLVAVTYKTNGGETKRHVFNAHVRDDGTVNYHDPQTSETDRELHWRDNIDYEGSSYDHAVRRYDGRSNQHATRGRNTEAINLNYSPLRYMRIDDKELHPTVARNLVGRGTAPDTPIRPDTQY